MMRCVRQLCVLGVMMLCSGLWVHCETPLSGAYLDGDVNCAILSSIHTRVIDLHKRTKPQPFVCTGFDLTTFLQSLSAIHTIEEINNSTLLPGIKLGYEVCDPCASPTKALHCVEHLLAINGSLPALVDYTDFRPPVKALSFVLQLPWSKCSESCPPGSVKNQSKIPCCYNCVPCGEGNYTDDWDLPECLKCPRGLWSNSGDRECRIFEEKYLDWKDSYPIALLAATAIGLVLVLTSLIIFFVHRNTVVIKKADNAMSCFMLLGLAVSFISVIMFISRPNPHLCRAQQAVYGLGFTLCVSCILVKAYRTFLAFMAFDPHRQHNLRKLYKPLINLVVLTGGQGIILLFWLIFKSPFPDLKWPGTGMVKYVVCDEGSIVGFGVMHGYIALLAFICFFLAFKGRKVPHDFNETGVIIFSMLIHLFVWLCFIPIYIERNQTEQRHIVQASAILASNYGIMFCHFVPKCYIVLWELSENSRASVIGRLARCVNDDMANANITVLNAASRITPDSGIFCHGVGTSVVEISTVSRDVSRTTRPVDFTDLAVPRHAKLRQRHTTH